MNDKSVSHPLLPLLILFAAPALLTGQQLPPKLPASAQPPEDIRELEELERRAGRDPISQVTREHVLQALERLKPGAKRPENLRDARPLPADKELPAELRELEQRERAAHSQREPGPPTREQLLDLIRGLPNGPQILEEARGRGAPIGMKDREHSWRRLARAINPLRLRKAWAQGKFSVTLTETKRYSTEPYALIRFIGAQIAPAGFALRRESFTIGTHTYRVEAPHSLFSVKVPADGWYVVNFRGNATRSKAQLVRTGTGIWSWDYSDQTGWKDFPALLQLSAGHHHFRFVVADGGISYSSVTVYAL